MMTIDIKLANNYPQSQQSISIKAFLKFKNNTELVQQHWTRILQCFNQYPLNSLYPSTYNLHLNHLCCCGLITFNSEDKC